MAHHAIVIGINDYTSWSGDISLTGAVSDALRVAAWLQDPKGGDVPESNLRLLLSPKIGKKCQEPTRLQVLQCIESLDKARPGPADRLFVYFAGHGMTFRRLGMDEPVLLTSDFHPSDTTLSLGLRSLLERLQATAFRDQFIFIDACRDTPLKGELEMGVIPRPRVPRARHPDIQQFVIHATSRRRQALAITDEGGFFTRALLGGLAGEGTAKAWDANTHEYVVRFDRLFQYVSQRVRTELRSVELADLQAPQRLGQQGGKGDPNPVLARFPSDAFPQETLEVLVNPRRVIEQAEVAVYEGPLQVAQTAAPRELPVRFELVPRPYHIEVSAQGYQSSPNLHMVELYESRKVAFTLSAERGRKKPPTAPGALPPGALSVESQDPAVVIEISRSSGERIRKARQRVVCTGLEPGYYVVRTRGPTGPALEQTVLLPPGGTQTVSLRGPGALHKGGPYSDFLLLTMNILRGKAIGTGVVLTVSDPRMQPRIWPVGSPIPVTPGHKLSGEGQYWVALTETLRGGQPGGTFVLPAPTLRGRAYLLNLEQEEGLQPRLSILYPRWERHQALEEFEAERLSLALQHHLLQGRVDLAEELARELPLEACEPMAACLAGYLSARFESWKRLEELCQHAARQGWALVDFDVLRWHLQCQLHGDSSADAALRLAVSRGPPLVAEGLEFVAPALERLPEDAASRRVRQAVQRHMEGSIFTAWTVPDFEPGRLLEE
jgi:hypothetical protein